MKKFTNKIVVVIGGSRGIGAAISKSLAANGAKVMFTYQNSPIAAQAVVDDIISKGGEAVAIKADSHKPEKVRSAIERVVDLYGHIDILVNNAGIFIGKPFTEHTVDDYDKVMAVNVQSVFVASLAAVKLMPKGGRIISIGSNMADNAVGPEATLYTMSKAALQGFTRGLARDLGKKQITVNLVQPGPINTDMNPADTPSADYQRTRSALGEYGTVDDIAKFVTFLASDDASYITGSFLTVDGGFNA